MAQPAVKQTIEAALDYTERGLLSQATQLNNAINYIQHLEEQTQTQWWAIAGWSESTNTPYSKQGLEEAIVRSAVELKNITLSTLAGPIAAPALFNMVLTRDRKTAQLKKLALKNVITATPREWRKSCLDLETKDPYARLCPIALAIGLATESNDEPDWEAQFARKVAINVTTEITPIEIATQLFRELLVLKGRD
ncbi:MAG: GTPase-associated system all-helical protein GASH [Methylobacter sp.]